MAVSGGYNFLVLEIICRGKKKFIRDGNTVKIHLKLEGRKSRDFLHRVLAAKLETLKHLYCTLACQKTLPFYSVKI